MNRIRTAGLIIGVSGLAGLLAAPAAAAAPTGAGAPTLVAIRAAHHPGFDRLVFQFRGGLPAERSVRYVSKVIAESGKTVRIVGSALLQVRFAAANGHDQNGQSFGPSKRTFALPGIIQVVKGGDFEAVLRFGVGVARQEPVHMFTLTNPARVVVDLKVPYKTTSVKVYLLDSKRFANNQQPFTRAVQRPVAGPAVAFGALQRLFAGATDPERATGLRFVASKATGFADLSIVDQVARVRLTGGCGSGGSTFTIADEIMRTLKQFPTVKWVKIYDPAGHTEHPTGHSDSIPVSLEP